MQATPIVKDTQMGKETKKIDNMGEANINKKNKLVEFNFIKLSFFRVS